MGRFLQPDPTGYAAGNKLYTYVRNDPLNLADPLGLCDNPQTCGGSGGAFSNYVSGGLSALRQIPGDLGSLLRNPSDIPGALAGALPGITPAASELSQVVSGAIGAVRLLGNASSPSAVTEYNLTQTVQNNASSRPYVNSPLTIQEITSTGKGVPDPGGVPGALRYDVPGTMSRPGAAVGDPNPTVSGTYELVIDPNTNTVYHFLFRSGQ